MSDEIKQANLHAKRMNIGRDYCTKSATGMQLPKHTKRQKTCQEHQHADHFLTHCSKQEIIISLIKIFACQAVFMCINLKLQTTVEYHLGPTGHHFYFLEAPLQNDCEDPTE